MLYLLSGMRSDLVVGVQYTLGLWELWGWFNLCAVCSSARLVGACSVYSSSQVGTKDVRRWAHLLDIVTAHCLCSPSSRWSKPFLGQVLFSAENCMLVWTSD